MNPYSPSPIDTSSVELSDEVEAVVELLARNAHEIWAHTRMASGQSGHAFFVPYDDLPDDEKQIDRRLVRETLKALLTFGYTIAPNPSA